MKKLFEFTVLAVYLSFGLFTSALYSGTSGKIAGKVVEAESGEPLPGANVILMGTTMGAATDLGGKFIILNVPPGTYNIKASMIGYGALIYENIRVSIDLTTTVNFELGQEILELGDEVTVIAERPIVQKDLTATTAVVGVEEISSLPIAELSEAIELQAGIISSQGALHIRGGRAGEIGYWIDGIPVTDVFDGGTVIDFNKEAVQELQVISGAFNAEYGQAQSGIINIATKEGSNTFGGSFSVYAGDHASRHDDIFLDIDGVDPVGTHNFEASFHGPILKDRFFYFLNGRYIKRSGWIHGIRKFNPNNIAFRVQNPETGEEIMMFREPEIGLGDNKFVDMNGSKELFAQAKLVYKFSPSIKLSYTYLRNDDNFMEYSNDGRFLFNPDGELEKFRLGNTHIVKFTHAVSSRTFYDVGLSFFSKNFEQHLYDDITFKTDANGNILTTPEGGRVIENPSRYVHPELQTQEPFSFKTGGTNNQRFQRETETLLAKLALTSQVTNNHQIKTGIEFRRHRIFFEDIELRPVNRSFNRFEDDPYVDFQILPVSSEFNDTYLHKPTEFSAYIQDKMEFESMIVNLGVRFDYFNPDGVVLNDESDPNIYNPIKPENRFRDLNGNGFQEPGEADITVEERRQFWFKKASTKTRISPRIGIAFPVTDRGVFHFSYGYFMQIPNFERLYQNPEFELGFGTGNQGTIGNADLNPEFTISGEIGLQQQIGEDIGIDITIFFRDIRNLAGTSSEEILVFGESQKYSKIVNSDFGFVRGVVLSLNKRFSQGFSANFDYTFQIAKATNSDPEQARSALAGGTQPEIQLTNVNWDQTHTVNASLSYSKPNWGGSLIFQYGSGQPFTPRQSSDVTVILTNSERKPDFANVDLRGYYDFLLGGGKRVNLFFRVFNLFDRLNELNVFDDTGRGTFTVDEQRAVDSPDLVNTKREFFTNPTHFSEPRRIEVGLGFYF
ncbi:MAG: TonB-dependent receptor [bacterium]